MASGNSGRAGSGSKGFDFAATDDILCSYEDFADNPESSYGTHSDPGIGSTSSKEFHKTRMARTPMFPPPSYISPEESSNKDVISYVERTMKKYTDNIMRFLEGISSRLSQLEVYCYNLDKSIGEMRSDLVRDHEEADTKLKSIEKHLQEVHRSVQILRDKQELADRQKELAKLQLAHKEPSSSTGPSQRKDDRTTPQTSDMKDTNDTSDPCSQQLALALPHQVVQLQQQPLPPPPPQVVAPPQSYYLQPSLIQNPSQGQYLPSDSKYPTQQAPPQPPAQPQANQPPQLHPLPQYQQQWPQQAPQQPSSQHSSPQPQIRPSASAAYPSYMPNQPSNPETIPNSMSMQVPYSGIPRPGGSHIESTPYGYGGPARPVQQQLPPQPFKSQYGVQNDGYTMSGPAYMMYQHEGGRAHQSRQPHYSEGTYPSPSVHLQGPPSNVGAVVVRPPQIPRGHPYSDLIDKLVGMGYRGDHVASVIQRLEENGQSVDFNAVLDMLNGHSSGGSQRGWSG